MKYAQLNTQCPKWPVSEGLATCFQRRNEPTGHASRPAAVDRLSYSGLGLERDAPGGTVGNHVQVVGARRDVVGPRLPAHLFRGRPEWDGMLAAAHGAGRIEFGTYEFSLADIPDTVAELQARYSRMTP